MVDEYQDEEPEPAETFLALFTVEIAFVAFAGHFCRCVFEFLATFTSVEGSAAIACRFEVGQQIRIFDAGLAVIGRLQTRDELAGAVIGDFIIVVTRRGG